MSALSQSHRLASVIDTPPPMLCKKQPGGVTVRVEVIYRVAANAARHPRSEPNRIGIASGLNLEKRIR